MQDETRKLAAGASASANGRPRESGSGGGGKGGGGYERRGEPPPAEPDLIVKAVGHHRAGAVSKDKKLR